MVALLAVLLGCGCLSFHSGPLPGEPRDATYAEVEGTRVRFLDTGGEGTPVLLLHGFASAMDVWSGVIPELARNHRVVALDLKGFGWTGRPAGDYSPAAQAEMVFALLDQLGIGQTAIVAHSWGSSVALAMTTSRPERVSRVALYDAWVYEEQIPVPFIWARAPGLGELIFGLFYKERPEDKIELAFYDKSLVTQPFVDEVEAALDRPGTVAAALAAVRGQRFEGLQAKYSTVRQPVLLLWGADDVVTTPDVAYRLRKDLPNAELVMYEACGHFPMLEAYNASTPKLVEFLGAAQ